MRLTVDGGHTLTLPADATHSEVLAALATVHPDVPQVVPDGISVVLWQGPEHWVQLETSPADVLRQRLLLDVDADNAV